MRKMEAGIPLTVNTRRIHWDGSKIGLEYEMTIELAKKRAAIDMAGAVAAFKSDTPAFLLCMEFWIGLFLFRMVGISIELWRKVRLWSWRGLGITWMGLRKKLVMPF